MDVRRFKKIPLRMPPSLPEGQVVSAPGIPDESIIDSPLSIDQQVTRRFDTAAFLQRPRVSSFTPESSAGAPLVTPESTRRPGPFQFERARNLGGVVSEGFARAGRNLAPLFEFDFSGVEGGGPQRIFDKRLEAFQDIPEPEGIEGQIGRVIAGVATLGASERPLSSEDLLNDPLMTALIAVPGGAAIGSPFTRALGPLARAAFVDSKTATSNLARQITQGRAGVAFNEARIVPRASDFAASTRTVDDVLRGKPNKTAGVSTPATTDPGTGELREIQLFERPRGGKHGLQIGGPLGPTQRMPEFVMPRVVANLERLGPGDARVPLRSGTDEYTAFKKFMVDHSNVLNPDIGTVHIAPDGASEFLLGTYITRRAGTPGTGFAEQFVMFNPSKGGVYRITDVRPARATLGTVTPEQVEVYAKASKDLFGDVMGEAIQPLRNNTSPFIASTINAPEVPAVTLDSILENIESTVAQSRFGSVAPRVRKPGTPMGLDMNTPSPRRPDVALMDDMELPSHETVIRGIQRKWEGARTVEGVAVINYFKRGEKLMVDAGVTDFSEASMKPLFRALHGELEVSRLSPTLRPIYQDLKAFMKAEEAEMLAFMNEVKSAGHSVWLALDAGSFAERMMAHPSYFPRGWTKESVEAVFGAAEGIGKRAFGLKASFRKGRVDQTFTELLNSGLVPASWNPYAMISQRRLAGVEYRESVKLLNRLRVNGKALAIESGETVPKGFKIPEAGPVFQGRPVPAKTAGEFTTTRPVAVPNNVANFLEDAYGDHLKLNLNILGKDVELVSGVRKWSNAAKSLKLVGSAFQHVDFATRGLGPGVSAAIRRGDVLSYPSMLGNMLKTTFSRNARETLESEIISGKALFKGRGISYRMIGEEGWSLRGDLSLIRKAHTDFMNSPEVSGNLPAQGLALLKKANDFWQEGLFEGVYRVNQKYALDELILPNLIRNNPKASDRVIAAMAADQVNMMYSTLGNYQTVLKSPWLKEFAHTLMFSTNESEGLIRSSIGAIAGPNASVLREWWLGMFIGLGVTANVINFAATGRPLRRDQYIPINFDDPYASFLGVQTGVGYNNQFLSPVIPFAKGRNGQDIFLDTVGQMDTAFRWALNPIEAFTARINVIPRAGYNQIKGETFNRTPLDTPQERVTQLALDLGNPIGGGAALEAGRAISPAIAGAIPEQEGRLGIVGNLIQSAGFNLRGQPTDEILNLAALDSPAGKPYRDLNPKQRNDIKNKPGVQEELSKRHDTSLRREQPLAIYFNKIDDINDEFRNDEGIGRIDQISVELGMSNAYRDRLRELHAERREALDNHAEADESSEAIDMLSNVTPFTSEVDKANKAWTELMDVTPLEDPVTGEWNFKKAEEFRNQMVAEFGEEIIEEVETEWRRNYTAYEKHLWQTRNILSENYWNITDQIMSDAGLTELYVEYQNNLLDREGFRDLNPELDPLLSIAQQQKDTVRQSNPGIERLLWAWDYIDTPQSSRVQAEVMELRTRQGGIIGDRAEIFQVAESFGGEILLGAPDA